MIPVFQDINELHKATGTKLKSRFAGFHIIRNEEAAEKCINHMYSHRCGFHQICVDHESNYELGLDSDSHQITNNQLYFIPKGTIISWEAEYVGLWKGYTIFFKPEFLKRDDIPTELGDFFKDGKPRVLQLDRQSKHYLDASCEQMLLEQASDQADLPKVLGHWFSLFLLYCNRYYGTAKIETGSFEHAIKYRFQELLNFNIEKHRKVDFYADQLNISPRHFTRLIKRTTGITAKKVILEKMTEVAKERLKHSELTISEIAYSLNFKNIPQFNKHFKAITGVTPSQYRRTFRGIS